jgi:hypothetical protein
MGTTDARLGTDALFLTDLRRLRVITLLRAARRFSVVAAFPAAARRFRVAAAF